MNRLKRWRWVLLILVLLFSPVFILTLWLRSSYGSHFIAKQIEKQLGAPVAIEQLSIGWNSTHVTGLDIADTKDPQNPKWLHIERAKLTMPLWRFLLGDTMPQKIEVEQARIELKFDEKKDLRTGLPQPKANHSGESGPLALPPIVLTQGEFVIQEPGKPTFHLTDISGSLIPDADEIVLVGKIADPGWGEWTVNGKTDSNLKRFEFEIRSPEGYTFDRARFNQIPILDASFWDNLPVEGQGQIVLKFKNDQKAKVVRQAPPKAGDYRSIVGAPLYFLQYGLYLAGLQDGDQGNRFAVNLALRDIDLAELLRKIGLTQSIPITGKVTVQARISINTDAPDDLSQLRVEGSIRIPELTAMGIAIKQVQAQLNIKNKLLEIQELRANDGLLQGSGNLLIDGKYPYKLALELKPRAWRDLLLHLMNPNGIDGIEANLAGKLKLEGTASPLTYQVDGTLQATEVKFGTAATPPIEIQVKANAESLQLQSNPWEAFGGKVELTGQIPTDAEKQGAIALKLNEVQLNQLIQAVPSAAKLRLNGVANGQLQVQLVPLPGMVERQTKFALELKSSSLRFQNIQVNSLQGTGHYKDGKLDYQFTGDALGGKIEVNGRYPADQKPEEPNPSLQGKLTVQGLRVSTLFQQAGQEELSRQADGVIDFVFAYAMDSTQQLTGVGKARLSAAHYMHRSITDVITVDLRMTEKELRIENPDGQILKGVLRGAMIAKRDWKMPGQAWFRLENAELNGLLPAEKQRDNHAQFELSFAGNVGTTIRGNGQARVIQGKLNAAPMSDIRIPYDVEWQMVGPGYLNLRDYTGNLAGGRISGKSQYLWSEAEPGRLEGNLAFQHVDIAQLIKGANAVGKEDITGRIDFGSTALRSLHDLNANIQAKLTEGRPFQLPILDALLPFLGTALNTQSLIQEGEFLGRLQQGILRIQRFTLVGNNIQFFTEGTVALASNRLQLQVAAVTGQLPGDGKLLRLTGLAPFRLGNMPTGFLAKASETLSNRTIRMEVTGTTDRPNVRLKPLEILTDEAVRFFLNQSDRNLPNR